MRKSSLSVQALMETDQVPKIEGLTVEAPTLEDIMVYHERSGNA